ncbi:MAG TPA: hypothetical protein PKD51_11530 [Saprospiraceae bacterium]|nr:hypothetical protein [Saprospiraceae bacterium]HMU05629.1 hypothetical protein [Saprospiraceae bacterium]
MIDLSTISDAPIETYIAILSYTQQELDRILDDDDEPQAKRLVVALLKSDKPEVVLNTLKWLTDQIEQQKAALPKAIADQITIYGELSYSIDEIIALHPENITEIKADWKAKKGLYLSYIKGIAIGKYKIDTQLQERAYKGDIKAIEMINVRKMLK